VAVHSLEEIHGATARAEDDGDPAPLFEGQPFRVDSRARERLAGGHERERDDAPDVPEILRAQGGLGVEALHLGRDRHLERGRVEERDARDAGPPGAEPFGERGNAVADRRETAEARHGDAPTLQNVLSGEPRCTGTRSPAAKEDAGGSSRKAFARACARTS